MNKSESNSVSKLLPRKERFQMFIDLLKKHFKNEHFYEFYQIANRYMRSGEYLTNEQLIEIEDAIRTEQTEKFFDLFINALRSVYKQDRDLFYTVIGYLFQLGNDTYLLELFLELEVDQTLKKLIEILNEFPTFPAIEDFYARYINRELFHKIILALQSKGLFIIPAQFSLQTFVQAIVALFCLTNVVIYPKNNQLITLTFEQFLSTLFERRNENGMERS